MELRALLGSQKQLERRRPYDMMEVVRLEMRPYQFLYREGVEPQHFLPVSSNTGTVR